MANPSAGDDKSTERLLLVLVALLIGVIAGIGAGVLGDEGSIKSAVLYGIGVFAGATLFVIAIEKALRLL